MTLTGRIAHGLSWSLASRIFTQGFQFIFGIVLARLLTPEDFGVVGMLFVITGFALAFSDAGLSSSLIYDQSATEAHFSTVFWLQVLLGVFLTGVFFVGGAVIARFYDLPVLDPLTKLISLIFVVQSLGQTHAAMLSKQLRFKELAVVSVGATAASGLVAVILAWRQYGVWSLAWQQLLAAAMTTALLWTMSKWRPSFTFDPGAAKGHGRYGLYLMGHTSINYWLRNGDKIAIGKIVGAHDLGIYTRAYSLMLLPLNNIGAVLGQVMFPALSQLQNNLPQFRAVYRRALLAVAFVMFPLMAGLAALCEPFVLFLLGPRWAEVVPVLQILSLVGLLQSIVFPVGWIFTALGKTKEQFKLSIILGVFFVVAVAVGVQFGIIGVAWAYAAWTLLSAYLNLLIAGRFIDFPVWQVVRSVARSFVLSIVMAGTVFALDRMVFHEYYPWARLIIGFVIGCAVYFGICFVANDSMLIQAIGAGKSRLQSVRRGRVMQ